MVASNNASGEALQRSLDLVKNSPYKDRVRILTGFNFQNVGPGWAAKAVQQLEADVKAGAVGVGELMKGFGITTRKADGSRLKIDDPDLDPIWEACARLNIAVFIHTADPQEFWQPIDFKNERWLELTTHADRRYQDERFPRFEELMAERDRLFKKHPKTKFVAAHMGWHANDLGRSGRCSTRCRIGMASSARSSTTSTTARAAHDFLVKYQDRVLFGRTRLEPQEYPHYWRVFETRTILDYHRDYHAFWKLRARLA